MKVLRAKKYAKSKKQQQETVEKSERKASEKQSSKCEEEEGKSEKKTYQVCLALFCVPFSFLLGHIWECFMTDNLRRLTSYDPLSPMLEILFPVYGSFLSRQEI